MDKTFRSKERRKQNRLESFHPNDPRCDCGVSDWQCLVIVQADTPESKSLFIKCRKCIWTSKERYKQTRISKRNSVKYYACTVCGDDSCYLEDHHLYCFGGREICVPLCVNCHAIVTDAQNDHPKFPKQASTGLEAIGLFLFNVFEIVKEMLCRQRCLPIIIGFAELLVQECWILGYECFEPSVSSP